MPVGRLERAECPTHRFPGQAGPHVFVLGGVRLVIKRDKLGREHRLVAEDGPANQDEGDQEISCAFLESIAHNDNVARNKPHVGQQKRTRSIRYPNSFRTSTPAFSTIALANRDTLNDCMDPSDSKGVIAA